MRLKFWDYIILTAANNNQAEAFRQHLISKQRDGQIDDATCCIVISDGDRSIGSGCAFLKALEEIYCIEGTHVFPKDKKILLINSGGESRRIPQYSVCGKAFAPWPFDNCDFFDKILESFNHLTSFFDGGMIISTSDILLDTNIDFHFLYNNTAFAVKTVAENGVNHGVFKCEGSKVIDFLHKKPIDVLKNQGAVNSAGEVLLDTGAVYFTPTCLERIYNTLCCHKKINTEFADVKLNFYSDFLYPLATKGNLNDYLSQSGETEVNDRLIQARGKIYDCLFNQEELFVNILPDQRFIHIGTTKEVLELFTDLNGYKSYNSIIDSKAEIGKGTYIENCIIRNGCSIGNNCFISSAELADVNIPDNTVVHCIRLNNRKYTARVFSVDGFDKTRDFWSKKQYGVYDSRLEAVKASLKGINGCVSLESGFSDADFTEPFEWKSWIAFLSDFNSYEKISNQIVKNTIKKIDYSERVALNKSTSVCRLPVRINFGGTWSDAAPYCIDFGGAVLNATVSIDGNLPISAAVKRINKDRIILRCEDMNSEHSFFDVQSLTDFSNVNDVFALHKAALVVSGIIPLSAKCNMNEILKKLGGGFVLSTCAENLPKGSGLGTSSLLLSAAIKALYDITGRELSEKALFEKVFCAEQLMKTGGGWQDQVGGFINGFKLITTDKGIDQNIKYELFKPSEQILNLLKHKAVLIYTGERFYGRFILSDIMKRCSYGDGETLETICELKKLALFEREVFENGNAEMFINCINRHSELLKKLSGKIENESYQKITNKFSELIECCCICGAGGGGFAFSILKKDVEREWFIEMAHKNNIKIYKPEFIL